VGMQLMVERGLEFEIVDGFGWIAGEVVAIEPNDPMLKIPHMGWNELYPRSDHPVLAGLPAGTHVYFVHGFELYPSDPANVLAETDYGGPIVAAVGRDNLIGTQFHPDKSQGAGLRLIGNFLRWRPWGVSRRSARSRSGAWPDTPAPDSSVWSVRAEP